MLCIQVMWCHAEALAMLSATCLHFDELFVVVFTVVVHQLHGERLPTGGSGTLAGILNGASHVVAQGFLATGCTLEDGRPAPVLKFMFAVSWSQPGCMLLKLLLT